MPYSSKQLAVRSQLDPCIVGTIALANNKIALSKYCVDAISKKNSSNALETSIPHSPPACLEIYSINGEGACDSGGEIQGCIIPI
ncbi:MAG: hypothetical protein F6J93_05830 [Oscillatoria sp. SIO1A7]|nr:hypothetical protein [Oscillatoria sp. SIO1A7]